VTRRTHLPEDVKPLSWVAEQLGISRATAYRLARVDKLPGVFRVGGPGGRLYRVSVPRFNAEVHGDADDEG
jgi:hypothetical protein